MKYAANQFAANGTAALALMVALLEHLHKDGTLRPKDRRDIIARAQVLAPQGVGITDKETREVLASLLE
jgi:hypothetical protein